MKRHALISGVILMLLVSACAPQSTPTVNPLDVQNTAAAAAFTMVAQTQAAIPTATSIPPMAAPTETFLPTMTSPPLPTQGTQQGASTGVQLPTALPTLTQQSQPLPQATTNSTNSNNQDICNQPLTGWQGPTANFSISNQTKPQGTIVLSMYVVTEFNQCGYLVITGNGFTGPVGQYSAAAFISGKQDFKAFGSFRITEGSWAIVVRNDSIVAKGKCTPNC